MSASAVARHELYRRQVLDGAERVFGRVGYAQARMADVAGEADLSLATVYKTFDGKVEIWDALHAERMAELLTRADRSVASAGSALERLLAGVSATVCYLAENPDYLALNLRAGTSWTTTSGAGVQQTVWSVGLESIEAAVRAAASAGEITDLHPPVAAAMVVAAIQAWLSDWADDDRGREVESVASEMTTYLRRLLAREPGRVS